LVSIDTFFFFLYQLISLFSYLRQLFVLLRYIALTVRYLLSLLSYFDIFSLSCVAQFGNDLLHPCFSFSGGIFSTFFDPAHNAVLHLLETIPELATDILLDFLAFFIHRFPLHKEALKQLKYLNRGAILACTGNHCNLWSRGPPCPNECCLDFIEGFREDLYQIVVDAFLSHYN
jgi:hypothetical protein